MTVGYSSWSCRQAEVLTVFSLSLNIKSARLTFQKAIEQGHFCRPIMHNSRVVPPAGAPRQARGRTPGRRTKQCCSLIPD